MDITRGGKPITATPAPEPAPDKFTPYHVLKIWDAFLDLVHIREQVIPLWERQNRLRAMIEAHPGHESNTVAYRRVEALQRQIRNLQMEFVNREWDAYLCWECLKPKIREEEKVHELFSTTPKAPTILGLWHKPLAHNPGAPITCQLDPHVFLLAWPPVVRAYSGSPERSLPSRFQPAS